MLSPLCTFFHGASCFLRSSVSTGTFPKVKVLKPLRYPCTCISYFAYLDLRNTHNNTWALRHVRKIIPHTGSSQMYLFCWLEFLAGRTVSLGVTHLGRRRAALWDSLVELSTLYHPTHKQSQQSMSPLASKKGSQQEMSRTSHNGSIWGTPIARAFGWRSE